MTNKIKERMQLKVDRQESRMKDDRFGKTNGDRINENLKRRQTLALNVRMISYNYKPTNTKYGEYSCFIDSNCKLETLRKA